MSATTIFRPSVSRTYKTGTLIFLIVSLMIAGSIAGLAFTKTTITVNVESRDVSTEETLLITREGSTDGSSRKGIIVTALAENSMTVDVASNGPTVDDYAHGLVTIKNNWTKTQPLAAGTRLRSETNGLIYKTSKRIDVPVSGQVDVEVTATEKGEVGNNAIGRLTIVALWPGLQSQIFGQADSKFSGGVKQSGTVTEAAIDEASKKLLDQLTETASGKLPGPTNGYIAVGQPTVTSSSANADLDAGTEAASFVVRGSVNVAQVQMASENVNNDSTENINTKLSNGEELVPGSINQTVRITAINTRAGTATATITTKAKARLQASSPAFANSRFTNKTQAEALALLRGTPGVKDASVSISPFWTSKTPNSARQITVTIRAVE